MLECPLEILYLIRITNGMVKPDVPKKEICSRSLILVNTDIPVTKVQAELVLIPSAVLEGEICTPISQTVLYSCVTPSLLMGEYMQYSHFIKHRMVGPSQRCNLRLQITPLIISYGLGTEVVAHSI